MACYKLIVSNYPVMKNKFLSCLLAGLFMLVVVHTNAQTKSDNATDAKINAIIKKLTLEEKIGMLHANGIFSTAGVDRLGIPGLMTDDGPLGVREDVKEGWGSANLTTDSATFFPNGSALAATWNPELAYRFGHDMGEEARARENISCWRRHSILPHAAYAAALMNIIRKILF